MPLHDILKPATQVNRFWTMVNARDAEMQPGRVQKHAEAWGFKKLISYVLRRLKMGHKPRVLCLHFVAPEDPL